MRGLIADIGRTDFMQVLEVQRGLNAARNDRRIPDVIIFNEHNPVYTVGIHRNPEEIVDNAIQPVEIERGGSITYHGPGQIVVYFIVSLLERKTNIKAVIETVQSSLVDLLELYGIKAEGRLDRETGVWTNERKICSIGFAIKGSSTLHGIALNVSTDLGAFDRILPCGFQASVMTSMEKETGASVDIREVNSKLKKILATKFQISEAEEIKEFESLKRLI